MFTKPSGFAGMSGAAFAPPQPRLMMAAYTLPTGQVVAMPAMCPPGFVMAKGPLEHADVQSKRVGCPPGVFRVASDASTADQSASEATLIGRVRRLSRSHDGCLEVQRALERSECDEERAAIARELRGHVLEACRCMHANHVIQKCIVVSKPQSSQFIVDELVGLGAGLGRVARHKYGCRVLQRLLEHCGPDQMLELARTLVDDGAALAMHIYGTYVVQCILEHGPASQRQRLVEMTVQMAPVLGADVHGAAVLSCALARGDSGEKAALARALAAHPDLLACMARTRRGHAAVLRVVEVLGADSAHVRSRLAASSEDLRACRYGKVVIARLAGAYQ